MMHLSGPGITCILLGHVVSLGGHSAQAKPLEAAEIVKHITKLLDEARHKSTTSHWRWSRTILNWRFIYAKRSHPNAGLSKQLVANAICRQHKPSIRLAHRLDHQWQSTLFAYREALIANEIARRQGLKIRFRAQSTYWHTQTLKEINRTRQIKHTISELGPAAAIKYTSSFHHLCRKAATQPSSRPSPK